MAGEEKGICGYGAAFLTADKKKYFRGLRTASFAEMQGLLDAWKRELQIEGERIRAGQEQQKKLQASLAQAETRKRQLQEELEQAQQEVKTAAAALREAARRLRAFRPLPTFRMQCLHHVCLQSESPKEAQEERYRAAKQAAENAMQQRRKAEALLQRYETDLPVQQRQLQERQAQYESELSERKLSEAEWKALAGFIAGNRRSRSGYRSMHILADMRQRKSWQQLRRRQSEKSLSRIWR